ncbi:MAG: ArsR family transcriptional regulator [Methanoregulaceae archaeon]|nr:ArsR family transcriptional regulator [Methanoregulaceae archaeon]
MTFLARVLDILGNRNRRRIIELLREKPCFVTEISDRLTLSPKAVIEHLQMMEREEILAFRMDERRRKYYFLSSDISIEVSLQKQEETDFSRASDARTNFWRSLLTLRKMVQARDELVSRVGHLDNDIEEQMREIGKKGKNILRDETELDLVIALSHYDLTLPDLVELTGKDETEIIPAVEGLITRGIIVKEGPQYQICDMYGE